MSQILANELSLIAYKKVKAMIIAKKLVPGKKIVQDKLAEDLGISRTPLRTALQKLESENLIQSIPRKGVIVREFSDKEIVEIYDCRIALEGTAIRLFTEVAKGTDIEKLKKLFNPFTKGKINIPKYQKADSEFHSFILQKCGNKMLNQLFQKGNLMLCIDMVGLVRPPEETINEHLSIIKAIESRDADLAESRAKAHLIKSKHLIQNRIDE